MARDLRLSYDADRSLVNDYDNSGSELARRWHLPVAREATSATLRGLSLSLSGYRTDT